MVLACAALFLWASGIISLFTSDPAMINQGATFLRISVAGFSLLSFTMVLQGAITGAGDTIPNMIISIISTWAVQMPLALWLPHIFGLGVLGVRWALVAGNIASSVIYTAYFRTGRWKAKKV
jgi:Na+-driven multidrug efflux pump